MSDVSTLQQTAIVVHALTLALSLAAITWAAILAGLSRVHWFWRAILICVPLGLLLPIRAYEPLVMLAPLMLALAVTSAWLRGGWENTSELRKSPSLPQINPVARRVSHWRMRISLADAFLGMTVVSLVLAMLVQVPWRNLNFSWLGLCFDAGLLYAIAVACLGIVGLRRGIAWAVLLFTGIFVGIVFGAIWGDGLRALYLLGLDGPQHLNWAPLGIFFLTYVTLLIVALWLTRWCNQAHQPKLFAQRRRLAGSSFAIVFAPGVVLYMAMIVGPAAVPGPVIRNNSVPQLVDAALQLDAQGVDDLTLSELEELYADSDLPEQTAAIYAASRRLVKQPGCVALDASRQDNADSLPEQELQVEALRALARRWSREADSAFRAGDMRQATEFDLDILRLGNLLSRGGIRFHVQAAAAIKSAGLSHLAAVREHIPLDLVPVVISVLESLDAGEENPQLTNARDRYWTDVAHGWRHRLETVVQRALQLPSTETAAFQALKQPLAREALHRRLLGTELALRHYQQEHGVYPTSLTSLVPTRLALMPSDPYTQQPLIYHPGRQGYVLYSTGPDARDDGGKFGRFASDNTSAIGQDWNLETLQRSGWRSRREWSSGQGRWRQPPGTGGWTSPPWDRTGGRERDPLVVSAGEQPAGRPQGESPAATGEFRPDQGAASRPVTEDRFERRSLYYHWRGRRNAR